MLLSEDKQKLVDLTQNQARFLLTIFELPDKTITANASGASQTHFSGKIVAGLRTDGFVEPMGFKGSQRQWSVTSEWDEKWKMFNTEIKEILDKISQE